MVFCFGELLLRMSPALSQGWIRDASMPVYIGGAELNAAMALSNWKVPVGYFTGLPVNYLADEIISFLTEKKINTAPIQRLGDRIGAYYLPQGADLKHAGVIYDRAGSSFVSIKPGSIDWEKKLKGYTWFHFSAINPALTALSAELCLEAVEAASRLGLRVSVDLNYRSKLWQYGTKPAEIMPAIVKHCDLIMGNIWAVESLLGLVSPIQTSEGKNTRELLGAAEKSMEALMREYPKARSIAYTFRLQNDYWAAIRNGDERRISKRYEIGEVVDRVGSGDCFMGGLIYGLYNKLPLAETIDFAAAAAVGKLHELGDSTRQSVTDVQEMISSKAKELQYG